jgi:hypothetical protein
MSPQPVVGSSSSTAPGTGTGSGKTSAIWAFLPEWRDGRLLQVSHVRLTDSATVTFEPFNASEARRWLGGGVLGAQMTLAEFSAAKVEPQQTNIRAAIYGQYL